jgi:Mn-dependent DtxR family transcriptional regulator
VGNIMDETIKELTLLLIYLTSWKEDAGLAKVQRSWKGYTFDALDELNKEGYIDGNKRVKSVYLTDEGLGKAKELMKKYTGKEE